MGRSLRTQGAGQIAPSRVALLEERECSICGRPFQTSADDPFGTCAEPECSASQYAGLDLEDLEDDVDDEELFGLGDEEEEE
jgi:hypothetical protein